MMRHGFHNSLLLVGAMASGLDSILGLHIHVHCRTILSWARLVWLGFLTKTELCFDRSYKKMNGKKS